eukprot:11239351-Alexandrium_andersonii.AAC.1
MSASLVGSEMCIRDRFPPLSRTGPTGQRASRPPAAVARMYGSPPAIARITLACDLHTLLLRHAALP